MCRIPALHSFQSHQGLCTALPGRSGAWVLKTTPLDIIIVCDVNNHQHNSLCILYRHALMVIHFVSPVKVGQKSSRNNSPLLPYPQFQNFCCPFVMCGRQETLPQYFIIVFGSIEMKVSWDTYIIPWQIIYWPWLTAEVLQFMVSALIFSQDSNKSKYKNLLLSFLLSS